MWHIRNELFSKAYAKALGALIENFRFHFSHINTGWAFVLACFAADAELHRFKHVVRGYGIWS